MDAPESPVEGIVPAEGVSSGTVSGTGALNYLTGEWINARISAVTERVNMLLDRLIDDGLLGSGYFPFETPVTDEMLSKMSPEDFRKLYDAQTDLSSRSDLFNRMKVLKLPPREMLPPTSRSRYPVPDVVAGTEPPPVESGSTVV